MSRRYLLVGLGFIVLVGVLGWGYTRWRTTPWHPALHAREAATRVLAEHLAARYPKTKALVVGNPFTQRSGQSPEIYAFEKAAERGLIQGFGSSDFIRVVYPGLRPAFLENPQSVFVDPKTKTPLSYLVADGAFDRLVETQPGFGLLISLIGVPLDLPKSKLWQAENQPRLGLLLPDWRLVGDREAIRQAIKSEKIAAAVVSRPGVTVGEAADRSEDYREEFQRCFFLVTKENVEEMLQNFPQLF